jgi:hypothetical protein
MAVIDEHAALMAPVLASHVSENLASLQVGGTLTLTDREASAETLVKIFVTRQVNLMTEAD